MDIPDELTNALDTHETAKRAFESMSPSHQRRYAEHVAEAKKLETRERRAQKMLKMILDNSAS